MPINLQGSGNIAEGWGKAPELDAPALGPLVASILANKLARDKMLQEGIGKTIKNVREERQGNALLEAMKAQGLVPEGYDAGGLGGAKLGVGLAKMLQDKREFEERKRHQLVMETRVGGRGGRGSRGDGGVSPDVPASESEIPEDYYGLSATPGKPSAQTTRTVNGIVQVLKAKGRWETAPKWMQNQGGAGTGGKPTDVAKAVAERLRLTESKLGHEEDIAKEKKKNMEANLPGVHYSHEDEYNLTVNRLKQLQDVPGMPSTEPAVPQKAAADKAGGHAEGYGVPPVGTERGGYRFKGGDPKDPNSWEKI